MSSPASSSDWTSSATIWLETSSFWVSISRCPNTSCCSAPSSPPALGSMTNRTVESYLGVWTNVTPMATARTRTIVWMTIHFRRRRTAR